MSAECTSYYSAERDFISAFTCPRPGGDARALYCCGFNDVKYCCDDPNSFFPYEYGYMWWLSYDVGQVDRTLCHRECVSASKAERVCMSVLVG
ncbi:protein shisa-like-2A [Tachysurus ichikawai]